MKIAIDALSIAPGMTGIGTYTRDLVHSTIDSGQPHSYFYLSGPQTPAFAIDKRDDLEQVVIETPSYLWQQLHLPNELAFREVDLHHSPLFTCPIVDEVPSVITVHDVIPEVKPELCAPAFLEFYRRHIGPSLRAAVRIITTSEFSKREIVRVLGVDEESVEVIYQGISPQFAPKSEAQIASLREKLGLPEKYILFVGMVEPRKNLPTLCAAFTSFAEKCSDVSLVIAGRKDNPGYSIEEFIGTGVASRVIQLGYVADEDLPTLYAAATVFAFPSLYEGFGRPVVEAMACGVPVVAANVTSLPEIAGEAALLVEPLDDSALAKALFEATTNRDLRERLVERGKQRAEEFTYEKFARRLVAFYDKVEALL